MTARVAAKTKLAKAKQVLRERIRKQRSVPDRSAIHRKSVRVVEKATALPRFVRAKVVGCYMSTKREVRTDGILKRCWSLGKKVCVPAFDRKKDDYGMAWLRRADGVKKGAFGIREPARIRWADAGEIDVMFVPAVAFDRSGRRLGHGAGYYDRLLAGGTAFRVGLAFEEQMVDEVPAGARDVPVDLVVTEQGIYPRSGNS